MTSDPEAVWPIELLRAKVAETHERFFVVAAELADDQLAWRPAPAAHSIGFTIWHTARAADNAQADLGDGRLMWDDGAYARRWGHPERGVGMGWDDERAAALPLPPKDELLGYARLVFDAVARLAPRDQAAFGEVVKSRFMSRDSRRGDVLAVCLTHANRHLGEIEYIKGLLGLRGSATV